MACGETAVSGQHNCRNCSKGRVGCFWHGIPVSSTRETFKDLMVRAFQNADALLPAERYAPLQQLADMARASMLDKKRGEIPLDDRPQALIDAAAKISRY
jgi:hypothetical protein